jgi:hypothetical protein
VVAVTAVPDALARQFATTPSAGCPSTGCGSAATPPTVTTDAHVEIDSGLEAMIGETGTWRPYVSGRSLLR